ncbi:MAG: DUF2157 domain-containing protein [Gammaproteobacteria bacterium]|nr:DUF2157 domain-containing protein [Gammaproteobacteria bacterium]
MSLRLSLYRMAAEHRLGAGDFHRLQILAGEGAEPSALPEQAPRGTALLASALAGFGLILWLAANWGELGRFGRFALLEALVFAAGFGVLLKPSLRLPAGLLAFLAIGGLFAYFGQTYQTGADPWQLFAIWAALGLPLCLALRSDVLWAPWALVVATGLSLWAHAHMSHQWRFEPDDLPVHAAGWLAVLLLGLGLGPLPRRWTGAGPWSLRTVLTLGVSCFGLLALCGLFHDEGLLHYGLGLAALLALAGLLATPQGFDVYGLSLAALGVDTLVVAGLARFMLDRHSDIVVPGLLVIGMVAAGLLAASVSLILKLSRRQLDAEVAP